MPVTNFVTGAIEDAIISALATDLPTVTDGTNTLPAIVSSVEQDYKDFISNASKGDGAICAWVKLRSSPDSPASVGGKMRKEANFRVKVVYQLSARQDGSTNSVLKTYLYNLRTQIYNTVANNRTWSGNAMDSYIKDEQEFTPPDSSLKGFELTVFTWFWYST